MFSFLVGCVVISILFTAFCRKGDKALDQKRFLAMAAFMVITYLKSIYILLKSFTIGDFVK